MDNRYLIAVASNDGVNVTTHFGRSESFYIYDVIEFESLTEVEARYVPTACENGTHNVGRLIKMTEALNDCRYVIATRIGPGARQALEDEGIEGFELAGTIEEAIDRLVRYKQVQNLLA